MGTKVRILCAVPIDGVDYKPDQVVDLPAGIAKAFQADGQVDANKDAVAYCTDKLGAKVIVHAAPAAVVEQLPADSDTTQPAEETPPA